MPSCPPNYDCVFTPHPPPQPHHYYAHWWDGPWGTVVTVIAILAVLALLCVIVVSIHDSLRSRRAAKSAARKEAHDRFIEEQRTMQLDACKGDKQLFELAQRMVK